MVTVSDEAWAVERDLGAGRLSCPGCGGRLGPWGWARWRGIRQDERGTVVDHHPRRARCVGCGATHVLLGASLAARRADGAAVIAAAVEAKVVRGQGHRAIAARLGRPAGTVRGWLRAFAASAEAISAAFMTQAVRAGGDAAAVWPAPQAAPGRRALGALGAYAAALAQRFGIGTLAWVQAGMAATGGWLFSASWWARWAQHELPLTAPGPGAGGSR